MSRQVIVIESENKPEVYSTLTKLCEIKGFSYHYLKGLKFPFKYKGLDFHKVNVSR